MSQSVTIQLKSPITTTFKGQDGRERQETVTELVLSRPKAKTLRIIDQVSGEVAQTLALIAALSGQPAMVVDELDPEDMEAVAIAIEGFFTSTRGTGRRRSRT